MLETIGIIALVVLGLGAVGFGVLYLLALANGMGR